MKKDKMVLANAFTLATAILWTLCSLIVWIFPVFSLRVMEWWMHGMDITKGGGWRLNFANFLLGGITLAISAWITGWVFGWSWEKSSGRKDSLER